MNKHVNPHEINGEILSDVKEKARIERRWHILGAATPRIYVMGRDDRPPTAEELQKMQDVVRRAMQEGALGVASALVYPPGARVVLHYLEGGKLRVVGSLIIE